MAYTTHAIRPYDMEGINTFAQLYLTYLTEMNPRTHHWKLAEWERLHEMLAGAQEGTYRLWLVTEDSHIPRHRAIAMAGLSSEGLLFPCWVKREHRGRGIHKRLIQTRVLVGGTHCAVAPANLTCLRNLQALGFQRACEEDEQGYAVLHLPEHKRGAAGNMNVHHLVSVSS